MSWNRIRQASLRARLLALLLPAMAAVAAAGLWLTRSDALAAANAAYDRSLLGAIKALDLNVSTASGGLAVELPYRLFEFFQLTASGSVYFRVATEDGLVEIGHPDLPVPPQPLRPGEPVFYDARYFDESVRLGAYMRPLDGARRLVIQVAESTRSRERFTDGFLQRALWRDVSLLAALAAAVALVSTLALRPLRRLAGETRARDADDLRPLDCGGLPSDVQPLVEAINQQLDRSARLLADRRRFVDDASHQLRTPLATLRAQVDYALREGDAGQGRLALEALSRELGHATHATNQLLALARSDAATPQPEPFDLGELAREVALAALPRARERGLDFGVDAPAACPAHGDRALLREALLNLVDNAIAHGRDGGEVTIHAAADALGHCLQVVDDGPGIPAELAERLGERFVKQRGSRGAGLGLAIARTVIERHGGRLRLEARDDGPGLRVLLWWPR
jgi:two-component system sensor histidine kinase TctE